MAAGTGTARSRCRCRGQKRAGARHRRRSAGRRLLRAAGGRRGAASRAERFQGAAAAEGASGAGRAAQPLQSGPGSVPEQRPRGRPGPGRRRDAGIPARARAAAEAAPAGGGRPRASGAGPARSGAGAAAAVRGLGVRRAMGEAGTGPGPGPREGPEPEEDEAAAAAAGGGGARGGRAGPRGGIRVLKRNVKRNGSRSCLNRTRFGSRERDWLREDAGRGCVYVYGRDSTSCASSDLRLVLCTVDTPASEICDGEERKNLFLQLHGDLVRDVFATEEIPELLTAGGDVLRVIELFRLETTSKITESNDPPNTAAPQLNHVPVHLIHTSLKHLQGWRLHHHPGQPVAMPNHPFREEILFPEMGVTGIALVTISVSNRKQSQTAPACISTGR